MSEFDELLSRRGVLMAGRFGPDWGVAESRSRGLFVEFPPALEVMGSFCSAIQSMFNALAVCYGRIQSLDLDSRPWLGRFRRHLLGCRTR
jgi:roadblock/LC7 domain-containing protein